MDTERATDEGLDPGAYIGHEPELEAESIPGGVGPKDERTSAYDSRPGVPGEPAGDPGDADNADDAGDAGDVVEGEIGHAHLRDPQDAERFEADLDALPQVDADDAAGARPSA